MTTICNLCGHSCTLGPSPGVPEGGRPDVEGLDEGGLLNAEVSGGYNSTPGNGEGALDDCTRYTFSICEFCLDWLFTVMVVPPAVHQVFGIFEIDEEKTKAHPETFRFEIDEEKTKAHPETFRSAAYRVAEDDWRKAKKKFYAESERRARARNQKLLHRYG